MGAVGAASQTAGSRLPGLPLHPLLAAAYPIVFLFATNAGEQLTLDPLWRLLLPAVGAAAAVLVVLWLLLRDRHRAALMTTVLVAGFFGYGHAWNGVSSRLDSQWPFLVAWLALVAVGLVLAWRARSIAPRLTTLLNLVTALALIMNISPIVGVATAFAADAPNEPISTATELRPDDPDDLPDIYYIVMDRYGGPTALRETYGYDNEPFLAELETRGFRIARHAHANYIKTPLSLVSSLNMTLLDAASLRRQATDGSDRGPIQRMLGQRLVVPAALKAIGYQYVHLGNWWTPTQTNVDADRVLRYDGQDELTSVLAQTTLLRAMSGPDAAPTDPWDWEWMRDHVLYGLRSLDEVPGVPGPKYVFAHLLIPHPPYVIDADGSPMERSDIARQGDRDSYIRFLRYGNDRVLAAIDAILSRDDDAIILLQGDEGPFPERYNADDWSFDWAEATDAELEEKFGIMFALRVPDADLDAAGFRDDITPVNAFRVIFNARFGTDLPMRPNRTWAHEDLRHFYDFFDITDRLVRGP